MRCRFSQYLQRYNLLKSILWLDTSLSNIHSVSTRIRKRLLLFDSDLWFNQKLRYEKWKHKHNQILFIDFPSLSPAIIQSIALRSSDIHRGSVSEENALHTIGGECSPSDKEIFDEENLFALVKYLFHFISFALNGASIVHWCRKTNDIDKEAGRSWEKLPLVPVFHFSFFHFSRNPWQYFRFRLVMIHWRWLGQMKGIAIDFKIFMALRTGN